jgi:alpha-tubulin suppressor-like RCC1 family protein
VFTNTAGTTPSEAARLVVSTTDYRAYGWGNNRNGQAGVDSGEMFVTSPTPMPGLDFVTQLAAGSRHGLALRADGSVESWGANAHGQLGNEEELQTFKPEPIEHLSGVTEVAAGDSHSLALLSNGTVVAWGDNEFGQLGNGKTTDSEVPVPVKGLSGVIAIAAGEEDSFALLSDGTVVAWGKNEEGQLGTGNTNNSNTPVAVKNLSGVTAIAAGGDFSMALKSDGTVVAWGSDARDELGNEGVLLEEETETEAEGGFSTVAVPVEGLSQVKAISAGLNHGLALLQDGTVMSWGDDSAGELGNGAIEERNDKASPIPGLSGVSKIAAGEKLSAAVLSSGAVMTWGSNEAGGLGIGETGAPSDVPVQAHNIVQATGIAVGCGEVLAYGEAGPVVSNVSPNEGPVAGGGTVSITGTNLAGASAVHFGTASATSFTVNSSGSITATAPAGTGTVQVTVTTPSGTSAPGAHTEYKYRPVPTVTKLSVKGGPATGGTVVMITGTEFGSNPTGVSFAGVPATSFKLVNIATIEVVAPPGVAGPADVRVTTAGGTSATTKKDQFRYAPEVEGVSPANGPLAGGNTVTITGTGFVVGTGTVKFKFGKVASKSATCSSSTTCTALVPAGRSLGTVDIQANANKGKSTAVPGDRYTYE